MPVTTRTLQRRIDQALGRSAADLVVKNARLLDVASGELTRSDIAICEDRIVGTLEEYRGAVEIDARELVAVPGFIDTHVHVESTLLTPSEFDRSVLPRGTTTAICDPHEIANVLGVAGLRYFLDSAEMLAMDLRVQLSSCVPSTRLETSGARLTAADLLVFRDHPAVIGLAEMMNVRGLLDRDPEVLEKLAAFEGIHIDGHAPALSGYPLNAYGACGIRNCHESTTLEEATEKLRKGQQVLIREGSVSRDVEALAPILSDRTWPFVAFCTDDRNPLDITEQGHIDHSIRRAIALGAPAVAVYRAASWSAARGFGLADRGIIAPGYRADIVLLDDFASCAVNRVICAGRPVDAATFEGRSEAAPVGERSIRLDPVEERLFAVPAAGPGGPVIGVKPGSIVTEHLALDLPFRDGQRRADREQGVQKLCVLARHGRNRNVGRGFVRGFDLREGALASSVGHDSHNVISVGSDDRDMALAVNRLIELQGGFVAARGGEILAELALPIAGLMSGRDSAEICRSLNALRSATRALGCRIDEAFFQLSFLSLPVIPHLKLTDRGLVDVDRFELIA